MTKKLNGLLLEIKKCFVTKERKTPVFQFMEYLVILFLILLLVAYILSKKKRDWISPDSNTNINIAK